MTTIQTELDVPANRRVTLELPKAVSPGRHHLVLVVDNTPPKGRPSLSTWRGVNTALRDLQSSYRREDIYGDDGR